MALKSLIKALSSSIIILSIILVITYNRGLLRGVLIINKVNWLDYNIIEV
jgi:hypothetical protein